MPDILFHDLIVSRPSPARAATRRATGIATAFSLHLAGIGGLILAPFLCLESVQPPKAITMTPILIVQPPPPGPPGGGDLRPAPKIRKGGGPERGRPTRPPRPEPAKAAAVVQPPSIPLEPPQPALDPARSPSTRR